MRAYKNYIWIFALLLASCATMPMPETNTERLAFLKTSFDVVLDKAALYQSEGRLTQDQAESLSAGFHDIDVSIDLAELALNAMDQGAFDSSTTAITTGLTLVRNIIAESENE